MNAWRNGRADGRRGIPEVTDAVGTPGYITGQMERGKSRQGRFASRFAKLDRRLLSNWCARGRVMEDRQRAVDDAGVEAARAEAVLAKRRDEYENARAARRNRQRGRGVARLGPAAYRAYMAGLFVGESALNLAAFQVLELPLLFTLLISMLATGALLLAAHELGALLGVERPTRGQRVWIGGLLAAPFAFAALVGWLRAHFVRAIASTSVLGLGPVGAAVVLGGLNVLAYLVAIRLSVRAHDPDLGEVRQSEDDLSRARKQTARAHRRAVRAGKRLERAHARRVKTGERYARAAEADAASHSRLVRAYVSANVRRRDDGIVALALRESNLPRVQIAEVFTRGPDWECQDRGAEVPVRLPSRPESLTLTAGSEPDGGRSR